MRSRLAPILVVVISVLVTASIIGGELVLLAKYDQQVATLGLPQLGTATMPDGTVLTLRAVSYGQTHMLPVPLIPLRSRWGASAANVQTLNHRSHVDRVVFIVTRHDPQTREFLDVDWWSHCLVQDVHGEDIMDLSSRRTVFSENASGSEHAHRRPPFQPLARHLATAPEKRVLLSIEFPAFRAATLNSLRFFNPQNEEVAAIPFTPSWTPPAAEWTPQSLPARADRGPVSLVLKDAQLKAQERHDNDAQQGPRWRLDCQAELQQDGQPARHWGWGMQTVGDVLGNEVSAWDVTLSRKEPAWRVRFQATRSAQAEFSDEETVTISGIRVLKDNTFDNQLTGLQFESVGLVPVASAGVGNVEIPLPYFPSRNGNYSSSGNVPVATKDARYAEYRLQWRDDGRREGQSLQIDTQVSCLVLRNEGLAAGTQVLLRTRDSQGNEVPSHIRQFYDFAWLIFFDAKPDVGELTCELLLQKPLEFEFFIQPPAPEPAK